MKPIRIPQNSLVVLGGVAGCGKSAFAAKHFASTRVVSSDECRAMLSDDPGNQAISGYAFELVKFIVERRLLLGRLTVADATHLTKQSRGAMRKIARRLNFNSVLILFDVSLETCLARNAHRDRVVPRAAVRNQYKMFARTLREVRGEGFDYVYVLDERDQEAATVKIAPPVNLLGAE